MGWVPRIHTPAAYVWIAVLIAEGLPCINRAQRHDNQRPAWALSCLLPCLTSLLRDVTLYCFEKPGEYWPISATQSALLAGPALGAANADLLAADAARTGVLSATSSYITSVQACSFSISLPQPLRRSLVRTWLHHGSPPTAAKACLRLRRLPLDYVRLPLVASPA